MPGIEYTGTSESDTVLMTQLIKIFLRTEFVEIFLMAAQAGLENCKRMSLPSKLYSVLA